MSTAIHTLQTTAPRAATLRRLRLLCLILIVPCVVLLPLALGLIPMQTLTRLPYSARWLAYVRPLLPSTGGAPLLQAHAVRPATPPLTWRLFSVSNTPHTAVIGHSERITIHLSQAHAALLFELRYPNGHLIQAHGLTDAHGYTRHTFKLALYRSSHRRAVANLAVRSTSGTLLASVYFTVQQR